MPTDEAKAMFDGVEAVALNASWAATSALKDGGEGNKTDYPDETRPGMNDTRAPRRSASSRSNGGSGSPPTSSRFPEPTAAGDQRGRVDALLQEQRPSSPEESSRRRRSSTSAAIARRSSARTLGARRVRHRLLPDQLDDRTLRPQQGLSLRRRAPDARPADAQQQDAEPGSPHHQHQRQGRADHREGRFANPRDAEKDWSNPAKTIIVNEGGLDKIKDRTLPQFRRHWPAPGVQQSRRSAT
jgi:hypothetical protein